MEVLHRLLRRLGLPSSAMRCVCLSAVTAKVAAMELVVGSGTAVLDESAWWDLRGVVADHADADEAGADDRSSVASLATSPPMRRSTGSASNASSPPTASLLTETLRRRLNGKGGAK